MSLFAILPKVFYYFAIFEKCQSMVLLECQSMILNGTMAPFYK